MKRTIYLNPTTADLLDVANEPNLSARVANLASAMAYACDAAQIPRDEPDALASAMVRYRAIIAAAVPEMTAGEWELLCDALNGSILTAENAEIDPALWLPQSVIDSEPDGLGEKWGVDVPELAARIERMPYVARCAIAETVDRFWRQAGGSIGPIEQQLHAAGARVASGEGKSA